MSDLNTQIAELEGQIDAAKAHKLSLIETEALYNEALNASLRGFNTNPTDEAQQKVDRANTLLADARKRLHTNQQSTKVAEQDLIDLHAQLRAERQARYDDAVLAHKDLLKAQHSSIVAALEPLVFQLLEYNHFVSGTPATVINVGRMIESAIGGQVQHRADAMINSRMKELRNG